MNYNDSTYGFNDTKAREIRDVVETACRDVTGGTQNQPESITVIINNEIITPISTSWYTKEGKDYFTKFETYVNSLTRDIMEAYNGFIDNINQAGRNWQANTGNTFTDLQPLVLEDARIAVDTSPIQELDSNGSAIIDVNALQNDVVAKLGLIRERIVQGAIDANSRLKAEASFIGGDQALAMQECFTRIAEIIGKIFGFLDGTGESEAQSLSAAITTAYEKQQSVATDTAEAFRSTN